MHTPRPDGQGFERYMAWKPTRPLRAGLRLARSSGPRVVRAEYRSWAIWSWMVDPAGSAENYHAKRSVRGPEDRAENLARPVRAGVCGMFK
jgi:hypothetical protein